MKVFSIDQGQGFHVCGAGENVVLLLEFKITFMNPSEKHTVFMTLECMKRLSDALNLKMRS